MDGSIYYAPLPPHWCDLPPIWDLAYEGPSPMALDAPSQPRRHGVEYAAFPRLLHALGTVWVCEHCSTGWVLDQSPEVLTGSVHVLPHPEWRPESRRERRRRLRVPWYRRTPRPGRTKQAP